MSRTPHKLRARKRTRPLPPMEMVSSRYAYLTPRCRAALNDIGADWQVSYAHHNTLYALHGRGLVRYGVARGAETNMQRLCRAIGWRSPGYTGGRFKVWRRVA